jgi:hypothetical protein
MPRTTFAVVVPLLAALAEAGGQVSGKPKAKRKGKRPKR